LFKENLKTMVLAAFEGKTQTLLVTASPTAFRLLCSTSRDPSFQENSVDERHHSQLVFSFRMVRYAATSVNPTKSAKTRGSYLRVHFKNTREAAQAINGMGLTKAITYLDNVREHKQAIPFRRFKGGIGRTGQGKEFKTSSGISLDATNNSSMA
jgi:hypothetical protein